MASNSTSTDINDPTPTPTPSISEPTEPSSSFPADTPSPTVQTSSSSFPDDPTTSLDPTSSSFEPPTTSSLEPSTSTSDEPSSTIPPSSTPPLTTSTSIPSTAEPTVITVTPSTSDGDTAPPVTVIVTRTSTPDPINTPPPTTTAHQQTSTTGVPSLNDGGSGGGGGGLSKAGKTAIAVVIPIVVVALLALAGLWFWRRRKQRKNAEELRRKEAEEYGFNPNNDPSLPPVALGAAGKTYPMSETEGGGYRGWGTTSTAVGTSAGRKASTTLSSSSPGAPISDTRSGDPLMAMGATRSDPDIDAEPLGVMGPASGANRPGDVHRGPSNASSSYSAGQRSDGSGDQAVPGGAFGAAQYYSADNPYGETFGGRPAEVSGQPVIRDNLARRATRIENPSHFPTQASAGISQNF